MDIKTLNEKLEKYVKEDYYPQIDDDDRLDGKLTLEAIKNFLKTSSAKNTMIGQEFLALERPMDELQLGTEAMEETMYDFTFICKQIILNAADLFKSDLDTVFVFIDSTMKKIINTLDMQHINISDDATQYAINALNLPERLKELCRALNTSFAKQIIAMINNNEHCRKALKLAIELNNTIK